MPEHIPATQQDISLILNELSTLRVEVRGINTRLDTQNGRIGKAEDAVLILVHDAQRIEKEDDQRRADSGQDNQLEGLKELFKTYISPAITSGGVLYLIAKGAGWIP